MHSAVNKLTASNAVPYQVVWPVCQSGHSPFNFNDRIKIVPKLVLAIGVLNNVIRRRYGPFYRGTAIMDYLNPDQILLLACIRCVEW